VVCSELHIDPWRAMEEWTWARFWDAYAFVSARIDGAKEERRRARVSAGLEKPRFVDAIRDGKMFGGGR